MRVYSVAKKLFSAPLQRMWFSQLPRDSGIPKKLEDWQYCRQISQNLSNSQYESVFSLFVNSYLERQILNLQIYHQAYEKLHSSSLHSSYIQVLYLLYRDQFQPHPLMSNWMTKMIPTENEHLEKLLRTDFQTLKIPFPHRVSIRHLKRQGRRDRSDKEPKTDNNEEPRSRRITEKSTKTDKQTIPDEIQLPDIEMIQSGQPVDEVHRSKLQNGIKQLIKSLNLDLNSCSKIVVHDIEVEFANDDDDQEMPSMSSEDIEYAQQLAQQGGSALGFMGPDIKKIKVGKIELFNDKPDM